eukprot:TRINITY_DN23337_c0_g1_i1.p1 TRINITY_DN23337_c0_g1~~TRINITY_DN23337_c0_g1_i1.p1  ORF type:complete len:4853 (-),score=966.29 TRINITY_DN23337_c0_g1_i1:13-14571(-)
MASMAARVAAALVCAMNIAQVASVTTTTTTLDGTEYNWTALSSGTDYTLGVTTVGTAISWGWPLSERTKVFIPQGFLWTYMAAGTSHSCGITDEGETLCWGRAREGQCDVPRGYIFKAMSLGKAYTCGITDMRELLCWGYSDEGALNVPAGYEWLQISAATDTNCGLTSLNDIICWGQQGYNKKVVPYTDNPDIKWEAVSCGDRHCCGMLTEDSQRILKVRQEDNIVCWGDNTFRQRGVPGKAQGRNGLEERFKQVSAGFLHTCGLTDAGTSWCWGRVSQYDLNFNTPKNGSFLSTGGIHACVILSNQKVRCWGGNTVRQTNVPIDRATYPPSIMEWANDPQDISEEDPLVRVKQFIPGYTEPVRTFQHLNFGLYLPEWATPNTMKLKFEWIDGPEDIYSPHTVFFYSPNWDSPKIHVLNISAFDLSAWYDVRLGPSPYVRDVTSTVVDGKTEHRLVDGAAYSVRLEYQDFLAHDPATHWLQRYEVTYDLETLAPEIIFPKSGFTKQAFWVSYRLFEDMFPDAVWITFVFRGASPGWPDPVEDPDSPYEIQVSKATTTGLHGFELNLGDLNLMIDGSNSEWVNRVFAAGGVAGPGTGLVTGGRYDMTLRVADKFANKPQTVEVKDIDFVFDLETEPVDIILPSTALENPIVLEYSIPELVLPGSVRIDFVWLRNRPAVPGQPTPLVDTQSPHSFFVIPEKERFVEQLNGSTNVVSLSGSNLFRNLYDEAKDHPDIASFNSQGTPVYSFLQPFSVYDVRISYQDKFSNPRAYSNVTIPTAFTAPDIPEAVTLMSRTSTALEPTWVRNFTGGSRILKYDVQLIEAPEPSAPWWNGTDEDAARDAAARIASGAYQQEQSINGQESRSTVFTRLKSSQHYILRVRAWNKLGVSSWSEWSILRVLSACGDGEPHDGEGCDDGNMVDGDGCSQKCVVELGWACEAEPLGLYADGWGRGASQCGAAGMDGLRVGEEECDDCNILAGDGCSPDGKIEVMFACDYQGRKGLATRCVGVVAAGTGERVSYFADSCRVLCGDGIRHIVSGEECDDGNLIDGDGCDRFCYVEDGFTCPTDGYPEVLRTACVPTCGDGIRRGGEACDDGNAQKGDGCSPTCEVEAGWVCRRNLTTTNNTGDGVEDCRSTCLNGVIDELEDCDDGNTFPNDGCHNCILEKGWHCQDILNRRTSTSSGSFCVPLCGDGFHIEGVEGCDDANLIAGDGCDSSCQVEPGWACEDDVVNGTILPQLCTPICGDGLLVEGEACDDGNKDDDDGCSSLCLLERGWFCRPEGELTKSEVPEGPPLAARKRTICEPLCGDGIALMNFGEECDDGNRKPSDGCDEHCKVETGYSCGIPATGSGSYASVCTPICGDGLQRAPETCDDGNVAEGDGCTAQCVMDPGYACWPPGVPCRQLCGDYLRLEGEECDDGNLRLADGCDSSCKVEVGWICESFVLSPTNATSVCSPICGNGRLHGDEVCDDGNLEPGDGCDENCQTEEFWVCCDPLPGTTGSRCLRGNMGDVDLICGEATCGNGKRDPGEACDDANVVSEDGCSPQCEVEQGFSCIPMAKLEMGRTENAQHVADFCQPICGDGLRVVGEECDDGNEISGDGCGPNCKFEQFKGTACPPASDGLGGVCRATCGDGVRGPVEECDDGNSISGDGCSASCQVERGFTCTGGGLMAFDTCWPICGDGLRLDRQFSATLAASKLEECDVGSMPARGCNAATCEVLYGWSCSRQGMASDTEVCEPICGDGHVVSPNEECDDNNLVAGDGCSPDCKVEALYECTYDSFYLLSKCSIRCGDGRRHPSEECDDGNLWDEDGCSSTCTVEPGFECLGGTSSLPSECRFICGDGMEVLGESCDDGNKVSRDGCDYLCQVEEGYHCTKAAPPGTSGSASVCSPTCGDGEVSETEECDDSYVVPTSPPRNVSNMSNGLNSSNASNDSCDALDIMCLTDESMLKNLTGRNASDLLLTSPPSCSSCRFVPSGVCGDFRRGPNETCDDGNEFSGDGCSADCQVELGWNCTEGPSHIAPFTGPGDTCTAVCGDGHVTSSQEGCDDGNTRGDDGCTGDCVVEPYYRCFLPGAPELNEVPTSELPASSGPDASVCVRTTPPRLIGAHFDSSFVTVELRFDVNAAPLPGEEYVGGVAVAAASFDCSVLLSERTVGLLGEQPRCWWKSRRLASILLGASPGLIPGSGVELKAGVLRRYVWVNKDTAPVQELKADVPGGMTAPVLWPKPYISGPQATPVCADTVALGSEHSQGFAGRMPIPRRWDVIAAFNMTSGQFQDDELARIQEGMESQTPDATVYFPKEAVIQGLVDFDYDRSLRVNMIYRIRLSQTNMLGLEGTAIHHLEVSELPIPRVDPGVARTFRQIDFQGRWLNLAASVELPTGCVEGDPPPVMDAFRLQKAPAPPAHPFSLEEPLRLVRGSWQWRNSARTTFNREVVAAPVLPPAVAVGEVRRGNRTLSTDVAVQPGTLPVGWQEVDAVMCINATKVLSIEEQAMGFPPYGEVCGYETFLVEVLDIPVPELSLPTPRPMRRLQSAEERLLREAAQSASLQLVGLPPSAGRAPMAQPLQAEAQLPAPALSLLEALQDVAGNAKRADLLQRGWLGAVEPDNTTTVLGAMLVPPSEGSGSYSREELTAALATLIPSVTWRLQATTRSGAEATTDPPTDVATIGGVFLTIPPGQLSLGAKVTASVELSLRAPPPAGQSCEEAQAALQEAPLRQFSAEATLAVNQPPGGGSVQLTTSKVAALLRLDAESVYWASDTLPLQYRLEVELSERQGNRRLLVSDWSFSTEQSVILLPRRNTTVLLRGYARDGRGTMAVTPTVSMKLLATDAEADNLLTFTDYLQFGTVPRGYTTNDIAKLLATLQSKLSTLDVPSQLQVWQDFAYSALTMRLDITVQNCTTDCGPRGTCPPPVFAVMVGDEVVKNDVSKDVELKSGEQLVALQSFDSCVCAAGWTGKTCEWTSREVEVQTALTQAVGDGLRNITASAANQQVLGITTAQGGLERFLAILSRMAEDCRRLPVETLATVAGLAAGMAAISPKAAVKDAAKEIAALLTQMRSCLPSEDPPMPMVLMPPPATVLLSALGSSEVCRPVETAPNLTITICYDLASSEVKLTCVPPAKYEVPIYEFTPGNNETLTCRADLNLGISDPYPCPCAVPDSTFMGFGRNASMKPLAETLGLRDEKDILWRAVLKVFWNNSMGGDIHMLSVPQPGPALAAALRLQESGQASSSEVEAALAEAEHWRLYQQGTVHSMQRLAETLSDAMLWQMVPGQVAETIDTAPVRIESAMVTVRETTSPAASSSALRKRTGVTELQLDDLGTQLELDYNVSSSAESILAPNLPTVVPMAALRWNDGGQGLFKLMDPAVDVRSDVVQLRLLKETHHPAVATGRPGPAKLRYRFMVPEPPQRGTCKPPTQDLIRLCCSNLSAYSNWAGANGSCSVAPAPPTPRPAIAAPVASPTPSPAVPDTSPAVPDTSQDSEVQASSTSEELEGATVIRVEGQQLPFEKGFEDILEDVNIWTTADETVLLAGTRLRLRGGNLKVGRVCGGSGTTQKDLKFIDGQLIEEPDSSDVTDPADIFCETVFKRARSKRTNAPQWKSFSEILIEAASEVIANPSLLPVTSTSTSSVTIVSSTTTSTGRWNTTTQTASATNTTSTTMTSVTNSTTSTTSLTSSTATSQTNTSFTRTTTSASATSSTATSATRTTTFTDGNTTTLTSTTLTNTTATATTTATTSFFWCTMGEAAQTDTWCPSDVTDAETLPIYADVEIADEQGLLLIDVSAVQLSLNGSAALSLGNPRALANRNQGSPLTLVVEKRAEFWIQLLVTIYGKGAWSTSWEKLHEIENLTRVLRPWARSTTTTVTSTTATSTSTTRTTSTTTGPVIPYPLRPPQPPGLVLGALETAFSDPLELLTRALALDLENNDGVLRLRSSSGSDGSWASRGTSAAVLLDTFCEVPERSPGKGLAAILDALEPAVLMIPDDTGLRPLHVVLQALDAALPKEWSASFWAESVGGPDWEPPEAKLLTTSTTTTTTTTTTLDFEAYRRERCEETATECLPEEDCGMDPLSELECMSWSAALLRWVPALGCSLAEVPGRRWPLLKGDAMVEVVCECEAPQLHQAMAVTAKRPVLEPFPAQVNIVTREFVVYWLDKANRYNCRGIYGSLALLIVALVHFAIAALAELRWRMQARWASQHSARLRGVQHQVRLLEEEEQAFIRNRLAQIQKEGEEAVARAAAEAAITLEKSQGLMIKNSNLLTDVDLRQARDGLATLLHSQGVGDIDRHDASVMAPPMAITGPANPPALPPPPLSHQTSGLPPLPQANLLPGSVAQGTPTLLSPSATMTSGDPALAAATAFALSGGIHTGGGMHKGPLPGSQRHHHEETMHEALDDTPEGDMITAADGKVSEGVPPEDEMITMSLPTERRVTLLDRFIKGCRRTRPKHLRRACRAHHKIFYLSDDTQNWIFSAPERASLLHFSLWINAFMLAVCLGGATHRRPYQDAFCPPFSGEAWELADVSCFFHIGGPESAVWSAMLTTLMANIVQIVCRGRSFPNRTKHLCPVDREKAFTRHFLGPWPEVLLAPRELWVRVWNCYADVWHFFARRLGYLINKLPTLPFTGHITRAPNCCFNRIPTPKHRRLQPLHWQPSLVPGCAVLLGFLLCWNVTFYMFFFSSSIYMYDINHSDSRSGEILKSEILPPDNERPEVAAVERDGFDFRFVAVPEMQRYLVLLLIAWFLHLVLFEPLLFALHLFIGEPSIDDSLAAVKHVTLKLLMIVPNAASRLLQGLIFAGNFLIGLIPEERRQQARDLRDRLLRRCRQRCWNRCCACCERRTKTRRIPAGLEETVESEDEDVR